MTKEVNKALRFVTLCYPDRLVQYSVNFFGQLAEVVLAGSVSLPGHRIRNSEAHQVGLEPDRLVVGDLALLLPDATRYRVGQVHLEERRRQGH